MGQHLGEEPGEAHLVRPHDLGGVPVRHEHLGEGLRALLLQDVQQRLGEQPAEEAAPGEAQARLHLGRRMERLLQVRHVEEPGNLQEVLPCVHEGEEEGPSPEERGQGLVMVLEDDAHELGCSGHHGGVATKQRLGHMRKRRGPGQLAVHQWEGLDGPPVLVVCGVQRSERREDAQGAVRRLGHRQALGRSPGTHGPAQFPQRVEGLRPLHALRPHQGLVPEQPFGMFVPQLLLRQRALEPERRRRHVARIVLLRLDVPHLQRLSVRCVREEQVAPNRGRGAALLRSVHPGQQLDADLDTVGQHELTGVGLDGLLPRSSGLGIQRHQLGTLLASLGMAFQRAYRSLQQLEEAVPHQNAFRRVHQTHQVPQAPDGPNGAAVQPVHCAHGVKAQSPLPLGCTWAHAEARFKAAVAARLDGRVRQVQELAVQRMEEPRRVREVAQRGGRLGGEVLEQEPKEDVADDQLPLERGVGHFELTVVPAQLAPGLRDADPGSEEGRLFPVQRFPQGRPHVLVPDERGLGVVAVEGVPERGPPQHGPFRLRGPPPSLGSLHETEQPRREHPLQKLQGRVVAHAPQLDQRP
mmetsp:Transcript_28963/g.80994  ORF Transcript_28963/g.80994 Transcript_28963/m.80994 type:complete len:581 (-) Transcript_28963:345-2087(-)